MTPFREGMPGAPSTDVDLEQRLEALENAVQRLTGANALRLLLDQHVPAGEPVAVLAQAAGGPAGVARLEAERVQGVRFLLVPEAARSRVDEDAYLTKHLREHFRPIAEAAETGTLFEAAQQPARAAETPALWALIDSLGLEDRFAPMLDWTSRGVASFLPGCTLFRPVRPGARVLSYLDHTIEIVLVDDPERLDEAARVAANTAVLVHIDDAGEAVVVDTRRISSSATAPLPVSILIATDPDDAWLGRFAEAVAGRPRIEVRAAP